MNAIKRHLIVENFCATCVNYSKNQKLSYVNGNFFLHQQQCAKDTAEVNDLKRSASGFSFSIKTKPYIDVCKGQHYEPVTK